MKISFWTQHFAITFAIAAVVIGAVQVAKGRPLEYAVQFGLLWGFITSAIFAVGRIYRLRRNRRCAICGDNPDIQA